MVTRLEEVYKIVNQKIEDYKLLVKFRLSMLVVFTAGLGFLLASGSNIIWPNFLVLCLGGFLVTGAANALNQVIEREYDKQMKRTENRPLAAGRMEVNEGVLLAGVMGVLGVLLLAYLNPLTALVGMISLLSYAFIYTPMKRVSPIAVLIGAFPGAFPPLIGWVAVTGTMGIEAITLFSIQFLWQFPHFWAIAWLGHDDYTKAGFNLLPSKGGKDKQTALQCLVYALFLIPVGMFPFFIGMTGIISMLIVSLLGGHYAYMAYNLYKNCDNNAARKLMFSSFFYLPLALIALYIDMMF